MSKIKISIFTPVFNEEDNIQDVYLEVKSIMDDLSEKYDYEHVFSDNCSSDQSLKILKNISKKDINVKIIALSRNFGTAKSTLNGILRCSGDAVIHMDADLQDPPNMIVPFIEKWESGFKIVYGVRTDREEGWIMKKIRNLFYFIANKLSDEELIPYVGEFRLIDKRIVAELKMIANRNPYLRGEIANLGFPQIGLPYKRRKRNKGKSNANILIYFETAIHAIVSHSTMLLRISTIVGILVTIFCFSLIIIHVFLKFIYGVDVPGITTIIILVSFFSGIQMIFLGIIGEYIAKISDQSIDRPLVIEEELFGFGKDIN
tara:strand:+ start:1043 stop:1993 length:951 start_codon:yes stop_codon:yes gene_type:complete